MKRLLFLLCLTPAAPLFAQIDSLFERIRHNEAKLTAFFSAMPKGGDLHHHYSGSVYAETFLQSVIDSDYFYDPATLSVTRDSAASCACQRFSAMTRPGELDACKLKLLQKWSVKDYNGVSYPSDKQFFETFPAFGIGADQTYELGLRELKNRAIIENVSYIETMFASIRCQSQLPGKDGFDARLAKLRSGSIPISGNGSVAQVLQEIDKRLPATEMTACVADFVSNLEARHRDLGIDDARFTMRYQTYITRTNPSPATTFRNLLLAFEAAQRSTLIVGVNIVAPEDNEISMRDYSLHMAMFRYCRAKYPEVRTAMHAGELALGMVRPEDMSWHIGSAVNTASANRIGHGADLPYEAGMTALLDSMRKRKVAIEINLYSNEFILKLKNDAHPVSLYRQAGVPIVICTDDAGVLRSNLTRQFVLLAQRYPEISYNEIRSYVYNSITYSFIEETELRKRLLSKLAADFTAFERAFGDARVF